MKGNQWSIRVPVGGGRLTSHDSHHRVQRFPSQQKQPIDFSRNYGNLLETDKDFWRFWMPWVEEASFISRWFCQFFQKNHHTSTSSRLSPMWASMILNVACAKEDATSFFYFPLDVFFFSPHLWKSNVLSGVAFQVRFYLLVDSLELTFWGARIKWWRHMNFGFIWNGEDIRNSSRCVDVDWDFGWENWGTHLKKKSTFFLLQKRAPKRWKIQVKMLVSVDISHRLFNHGISPWFGGWLLVGSYCWWTKSYRSWRSSSWWSLRLRGPWFFVAFPFVIRGPSPWIPFSMISLT